MRICRVTPTFPSDLEPGIGLPAFHLAARINSPTLVITRSQKGNPRALPSHANLRSFPYPDAVVSGTRGWKALKLWVTKIFGYILFFMQTVPVLIKFRPLVIHLHTPIPLLQGLFAKWVLGSQLIVQMHGSDIIRVRRSRLLRRLLAQCDCVMYVSKTMESTLMSFLPEENLMYVGSGVDTIRFIDRGMSRRNQICMIGSLRWQKGYRDALKAFSIFSARNPDYQLVIVGKGPLKNQLMDDVVNNGLKDKVDFIESLSRDGVAELLNLSKVLMISSVSEGFPKVLLEAPACGTPVVATDVGSCAEVASKSGIVVAPGDIEGLASGLLALTEDSAKWSTCSIAGPAIARFHDWANISRIVAEKYNHMLGTTN